MRPQREVVSEFALRSLASLAHVSEASMESITGRLGPETSHPRGAVEIPGGAAVMLARGWACRCRNLADGRRQVFGLVIPGDIIGLPIDRHPAHTSQVVALTPALAVGLPLLQNETGASETLVLRALAFAQRAVEEQLFGQMLRLGHLSAADAAEHLFRELSERLARVGLCHRGRFDFPLSQRVLADILGLSGVHLNRSLADLRSRGRLESGPGWIRVPDDGRDRRSAPHPSDALCADRKA